MKARCLLSTVDRLPTIKETRENNMEDGDPGCSSHTMEEYLDSIKELCQPAAYPLHGPLRGHRRWVVRPCPADALAAPSAGLNLLRTYGPRAPVDPSDVSVTFAGRSDCDPAPCFDQNLLDASVAQSLFVGLA